MIRKTASLTAKDQTNQLARCFKTLGDPTRLHILVLLRRHDELDVKTLCGHLTLSQPLVSHHLALLRDAALIDQRKQGKHRIYSIRTQELCGLLEPFVEEFLADDGICSSSPTVEEFETRRLCATSA